MLGSTVLGGVMSIWADSRKAKAEEQQLLITRGKFQLQAVEAARNVQDKGFQWTRRIIALTAVFSIVVLPKLVAVFAPDVSVTVGYTEFKPGFLFFTKDVEIFKWITFEGLVITQLDTYLVSAIIGMYFGGSLVKK